MSPDADDLVNSMQQANKDARPIDAILIAGPTASGKSALALTLAERHRGLVINADSMQVYRDLRVLSARPTGDEEAAVPHRLYGFVPAEQEYTVADYLRDARRALAEAREKAMLPIFVGGTGLYFKALTQGLAETPPIDPAIRRTLEAEAERGADMHARLAALDADAAQRLSPADLPRILRALEVVLATGRTLAHWQKTAQTAPLLAPGRWLGVFLALERDLLKRRIAARFATMIEAGALAEVAALMRLGPKPNRGVMKAHGVPHLVAHLAGTLPLADAIERGIIDTRRYAKRQGTFMRGQLEGFSVVSAEQAEVLIEHALRNALPEPRWRDDLDALEFRPAGHQGRCVVHRLAFRKALGPAPTRQDCLALFRSERLRFEAAARARIDRAHLAKDAHFHLDSRDLFPRAPSGRQDC